MTPRPAATRERRERAPIQFAAFLALAAALAVTLSHAAAPGPAAERFLQSAAGFSRAELARVARGEVVAKTLPADASEVAICSAVQISVPATFYVAQLRAIETFKRGEQVPEIRRFGAIPSAADMAELTIEDDDLRNLLTCRPGHCGVKLDAAGIKRIAALEPPGGERLAGDALREHLAEYARRYLAAGDAALIEYHDREEPVRMADELRKILDRSPDLARDLPALGEGTNGDSPVRPSGFEEFLYWSKERTGRKPLISITHMMIGPPRESQRVVASKQIYANHYLTASLGLTVLFDAVEGQSAPITIVYINRSRVDAFTGVFAGVVRSIVRSRARSAAERLMRQLSARLERDYARQATGGRLNDRRSGLSPGP